MNWRCGRLWPWMALTLLLIMFVINIQVLRPWTAQQGESQALDRVVRECEESSTVQLSAHAQMTNLSSLPVKNGYALRPEMINVVGHIRPSKGFLTIGMPSIKRINDDVYLMRTLESIVEQTSAAEKDIVTVTVFLGDLDEQYKDKVADHIGKKFPELVKSGFILILRVTRDFYPPLADLKRNFNDAPTRVTWRSKQVIDFALMFSFAHARNLSDFYVQIEDDVICAKNFVPAIRDYIHFRSRRKTKKIELVSSEQQWTMLEFSELGFIGKLFRTEDLDRLVNYLLMFYDEQPVDWLMTYFRLSCGQRKVYLRKPTLFQHVGLKSSFDLSKDNQLKDKFFDAGSKPSSGADNPPALVVSTMPHHKDNIPELAYASGSGFFWATKAAVNDTITIVLEEPRVLTRVVVQTGHKVGPEDLLRSGTLLLSSSVIRVDEVNQTAVCDGLVTVGKFRENGSIDVGSLEKVVDTATKCVVIQVGEAVEHWVLFSQIALYLAK